MTNVTEIHTAREAWLMGAADLIRKRVFEVDDSDDVTLTFEIPEFRVSVGWPLGKRSTTNVIGECHNSLSFEDGIPQVFISPVLKDRLEVLRCLVHEMIHVHDDCQNGHRGRFAYIFKLIGMVGKPTQTDAGEDLRVILSDIAEELGKYPHGRAKRGTRAAAGPKKQASRMIKVCCVDPDCGYVIRTVRSNINRGLPTCFCGSEMKES